jgi:coiled-coil domain-containing protein 12
MTDRKARLAALAAKAGRSKEAPAPDDETAAKLDEVGADERRVQFRNYTPADTGLEEPVSKRPRPSDDDTRGGTKKEEKSVLEQALEKARAEVPVTKAEDSIAAVAPKKINWDLKRNIQPKLDKLEKRTQKAIVALLKERLEKEAAAENDLD